MAKVTCEGTLTTILSVLDQTIQNELVFKTIISCDCSSCSSCRCEIFVVIGKSKVKYFCITQKYLVLYLSNTLKLIEKEKIKHVKFEKVTSKNQILEQIKPLTFTKIIESDK